MTNMHKGDHVSWNTPQGKTHGKITRRLTKATSVQGHAVKASPNEPQFEVTSDASGKKAVHKPESLSKS